jgi:hypothetical protein
VIACVVLFVAMMAFGAMAATGNLSEVFGLPAAALSIFSHNTPANPSNTATPAPVLTVQPASVTVCSGGSFTILYRGTAPTMTWSASAPTGVTLTPSSGTLASGVASAPVVISAAYPASGPIIVTLPGTTVSAGVALSC